MKLLSPLNWSDYEMIDTGNFEKLERFGDQIVARPEPQAVWNKSLPQSEWQKLADAYFQLFPVKPGTKPSVGANERGEWKTNKKAKEQWFIEYNYCKMKLKFKLKLTSFGHIGIFPEQASNWNYIFDTVKSLNLAQPKVLNLFAYTGGASIAARAAGAEVTHVDSVKQIITWARENMETTGLSDIRWMVDDAVKFVNREVRRGNKYNGIILDPPAYGRGPDGERWVLEDGINDLLKSCDEIFADHGFVLLNLYSLGLSSLVAQNLLNTNFRAKEFENGELFIPDRAGRRLPHGVFSRFVR